MATAVSYAGPKGHFLTGNLPEFRRDPLAFLTHCAREYGDVALFYLAQQPVLLLSDPHLIEQVLVVHNRKFTKSRGLRRNRLLLGEGLLVSEGEAWLRQRKLMQPAFHRERIDQYAEVMVERAQSTLGRWQDGAVVDIHKEMVRLTLEIVGRTLFGTDVADEAGDVGNAMHVLVEVFRGRPMIFTFLPENLPTPGNLRARKAIESLDKIVYGMIERRRADRKDRGDLLSILLRAQDEDGARMTDKQLRDEVMTLFLAGHETTALALTWAFYLLAQNPEVEERLHAELQQTLGDRPPAPGDYPRLKYVEAVVSESMRIVPPAWVVGRQAVEETRVGDVTIAPDTIVFMSQWVMHRDPRFFEEPERFDPERWMDGRDQSLPKFAYFPFGGGPRHCIGHSFAMMEATLLLAAISQQYRLELVPNQRVELVPALTLRPRYGLQLRLHRRTRSRL